MIFFAFNIFLIFVMCLTYFKLTALLKIILTFIMFLFILFILNWIITTIEFIRRHMNIMVLIITLHNQNMIIKLRLLYTTWLWILNWLHQGIPSILRGLKIIFTFSFQALYLCQASFILIFCVYFLSLYLYFLFALCWGCWLNYFVWFSKLMFVI